MRPDLTFARERAAAVAWTLTIGVLGTALALQGWRATAPGAEVIPFIDAARALLATGLLPDRGVITSLHSYSPPGLAWVMLPGIALFSDARLFDVPGWVFLHFGTLAGVFLLARACFGTRCAFVSTLLYGLGAPGLGFAGSVGGEGSAGPSGHPFFYVWIAWWTHLWVVRRDARYLAAACLTWAVGMWIFMEVAPAALMIPVAWLVYRPPVEGSWLLLAVSISCAVWFPYLRFETTRSYVDIRSQLFVQDALPARDPGVMCDPALTARRWANETIPAQRGTEPASRPTAFVIWSGGRVLALARGLTGNFEGLLPGAELALLALTLAGLAALSARPIPAVPASPTMLAIGLLASAAVVNEVTIARVLGPGVKLGSFAVPSIRMLQGLTVLAGLVVLMRRPVGRCVARLRSAVDASSAAPQVLAIALAVPWATLLLVSEPARQDRFLGLWCLQAIVLAFVVSSLPAVGGRSAGRLGAALILLLVLINPAAVSNFEAWHRDGWSGRDGYEVQVADFLARRLRSEGRGQAAIGYRLFADGPPAPPWKTVDPRWKIGEEFDAVLAYTHGISNLDRCVEGASADDDYRVVEIAPLDASSNFYFDVAARGRLRWLDRIGMYDVYRRE